jgi:tetratricopeptide (TPR) repeat protein
LEARGVSEKAVELDPQSSLAAAINAFVLDWNANPTLYDAATAQKTLLASELEAVRALNLDKNNTLAMAYYAEILTDQQKIVQARQYIQQALATGEEVMDVHRVLAYVNEAEGNYGDAIQQYKLAVEITPNLTILYISIGLNYRVLGEKENNPKSEQYNFALEYFEKAVRINQQNQVSDPIPYIAIGKTYAQMGEFFSAARNVRKALAINPNNPDVYGTLGLVYFRARNYESAIPALKCATYGCTAEESCDVRQCDSEADALLVIEGMPLSQNTVIYYYTYGSVLAGMHRPGLTYCTDAVKALSEVRNSFSADVDIMSIVEASESICARYGTTSQLATPQPSATPIP